MKLIVITTETFFAGEAEAINLLFENGMEVLHVRKPLASMPETEMFIGQINENFHPRIVIHDFYELTKSYDLKGVHLNRRNQGICMEEIMHSRLSISRSCHSFKEVSESHFCDYVFLSPIFDSISKVGYRQGFTSDQLSESTIDKRVIALGGITADNIHLAREYGFGGVAVIGALWSDFASNRDVNALLERFNVLKMKCVRV